MGHHKRDPLNDTETSKSYYKEHSWLFDDDLSVYEGTKPRTKTFSEEFCQVPHKKHSHPRLPKKHSHRKLPKANKKPLGIPKGLKVAKRK
jgi:hypothetical protein